MKSYESTLRIHFIGQYGVGKRSLAYALGATPVLRPSIGEEIEKNGRGSGSGTSEDGDEKVEGEVKEEDKDTKYFELYLDDQTSMDLNIDHTIQDFTRQNQHKHYKKCGMDLFVLIFDLTNANSTEMILSQYKILKFFTPKPKVFLVGTKNDLYQESQRQIFASHAQILANEIEFDQYFELSSVQPLFHGLEEFLDALKKWKTTTKLSSSSRRTRPVVTVLPPPSSSSSFFSGQLSTTKTLKSIWLFEKDAPLPLDKEEKIENNDQNLRSLTKILYEFRTIGSENWKKQIRQRDLNSQKLLSKVQYHEPTESSIHRRCRHQQEENTTTTRPKQIKTRTATTTSDCTNKNFMRPTELSRLRFLEKSNINSNKKRSGIRANANANANANAAATRAKKATLVISRLGNSKSKTTNISSTTTTPLRSESLTLLGIDQQDEKSKEEWSPLPPPLEEAVSSSSPPPASLLLTSRNFPPSPLLKKEPANLIDDELPKGIESILKYFEDIAFRLN
jgi:hypothetical protein